MKLSLLFLLALAGASAHGHKPPKVAQAPRWLQKKLKPIVKKTYVALRTL